MSYLDHNKKRPKHNNPKISFIIPCYNDGDSIEKTIHSIYHCYDKDNFQLIVINDKSKDNSKEKIEELKNQYDFLFIDQEHNTGKSIALNNAIKHVIHDIIIFIDADTLLNKNALNDILQRLQHEKNVVAVTCGYRPINKGFLPIMQQFEYNVARFTMGSYNYRSSILTMRGGCIGIYKKSFEEAEMFSINAISEDMDLALKLRALGHRAQQSLYTVDTLVPDTLRGRYKQKIRRSSGGMQCLIKHFKIWIQNPVFVIFTTVFQISLIFGTFYLIKNSISFGNFINFCITLFHITTFTSGMNILQIVYGDNAVANTTKSLAFSLLSLPYAIPLIKKTSDIRKILYIVPYSIIYIPMHSLVRTIGTIVGIKKYFILKENKRGR